MTELSEPLTFGSSFSWRNPIIRKAAVYLATLSITVGVLALLLVSPLLLRQLTRARGIDWTELSNIGQTYGAASAILSGIALIGISLSLLIQAQQARTERTRITRERHMELLRLILDAPDVYGPVIGFQARSTTDARRFLFSTMWVNYARLGFQIGVLTEEILRDDIFGPAFRSEPMRTWWVFARESWSGNLVQGRRERRFVQIIDDEYRRAVTAGPSAALNVEDAPPSATITPSTKHLDILTGTALGVTIGILLGSRLRQNRH